MSQIIWQQSYSHKWCGHSPFPLPHGHDVCEEMHGSVGVLKEAADYFLFAQVNGVSKQWKLTSGSFEIPYYIFSLKITISNLTVGINISFDIEVDGCIGTTILGLPVHECVKLFSSPVHIHKLAEDEIRKLYEGLEPEPVGDFYSYRAGGESSGGKHPVEVEVEVAV